MINSLRVLFFTFVLGIIWSPGDAFSFTDVYRVTDLELSGNPRTNRKWIIEYLDLRFPAQVTEAEAELMARKLQTTDVFTSVSVLFRPTDNNPDEYVMVVMLTEKWTTVPVIRGAIGGGTPLRVLGVYETHALGRLWTIGAESRKYGDAPTGFVTWARAPRWLQGKHVLGLEAWRDFRKRTVYDVKDKALGSFQTNSMMLRGLFMAPLKKHIPGVSPGDWQFGTDLRINKEGPVNYAVERGASSRELPGGIRISKEPSLQTTILGRFVYDNIEIESGEFEGLRTVLSGGPLHDGEEFFGRFESEGFYYARNDLGWSFGMHGFAGVSTTDALQSIYFLGGFDSIRGIPDGALYGSRAGYGNAELRKLVFRNKRLHAHAVAFTDAGGAGADWVDARESVRSSAGLGVRLAIPQIYRMMLRVDYAWSLESPGISGLSAGLNHFFDPYRPL